MRRILFLTAGLLACMPASAQTSDDLRKENAILRRQVDSLLALTEGLTNTSGVIDTWSGLEDLIDDGLTDLTTYHDSRMSYEDSYLFGRLSPTVPSLRLGWNPELRRYVHYFTSGGHRRRMPVVLAVYGHYFKMFKAVFAQYGVPEDIVPLCIVESAVSPRARSRVGAVGVWQFMPETAKGFGLRVDDLVDDRMNIYKSTTAAARYLAGAYKNFGRWDLAVLSYNCGAGNITKAIIRSGGKRDVWGIYDHLPNETKGYLPSLAAAAYVVRYHTELGIPEKDASMPVEGVVVAARTTSMDEVSRTANIPSSFLKKRNPHILTGTIPAGCMIILPAECVAGVKARLEGR